MEGQPTRIGVGDARAGRVFALLAAVILGTAYIATAFALRSFTPMSAAMWRGLLSSLFLVPLVLAAMPGHRPRSLDPAGIMRVLILGLCGGLGLVAGMNFAIAQAGATVASFCIALASVFAAVMAPAIVREPLRANALMGFVIAIVGTAILTGLTGVSGDVPIFGVAAGLAGAVSFAAFLVLSRRWAEQYRLSGPAVALAIAATTGIGLLAVELAFEAPAILPGETRPDALLGIAWLAVMPGVGAQLLLVASSRRIEVSSSGAILLAKPVATALLAAPLLGELLSPAQLVGAILVLAGIVLAERKPRQAQLIVSAPG